MCGIAGFFSAEGQVPTRQLLRLWPAVSAQSNRGPDVQSVWTDGFAVLGCARLIVTGNHVDGAQPIRDRRGGLMVFNGEIYSNEAGDAPDRDGTALAAVLATTGPAGLARLHGAFAAARYDPATRRLLLVRDALGKKPLYVMRVPGGWVFGSTVVAIRALAGPLRVRPDAEIEYLVYRSVGGHRSAFMGVDQVPPGGWMEISAERVRAGTWWSLPDELDHRPSAATVRRCVSAAITSRIPARPFGVFLSGGLDSAIVAAVAARYRPAARAFTMTYPLADAGSADESGQAAALAARLGLPLERVACRAVDVPALLEQAAVMLEDPIQDPVVVPTLLLARAAGATVRVVLTGDGSDEVWGGYERYVAVPAAVTDYLRRTTIFEPAELGLAVPPASYLDQVPPLPRLPSLDRYMRLECANRMRNYHLARVDKLVMGTAVEPRTPFVDVDVVRLGLATPAELKIAGGTPKALLRAAFAALLPAAVVRVPKQPFTVPITAWLRGPLREYALDTLGDPAARCRAFVPHAIRLIAALDGDPRTAGRAAHQVWSLLQYEAWARCLLPMVERRRSMSEPTWSAV
jgi:asparagine synthase (glutamine-hydrolysing)